MLTPEQVTTNFERMQELCSLPHLQGRSGPVLNMISSLGERLALCPGSAKDDFHNAFPGGLVEHSLRVHDFAMAWIMTNKHTLTSKIRRDSLTIACLFHDLGKVGNAEHEYYVPLARENEWKRDKWGQHYDYNDSLVYMTVPQRGLWLMQHYGVTLSEPEYLAILLNDGQYCPENKPYAMKEPELAILVHQADLLATRWEKAHKGSQTSSV